MFTDPTFTGTVSGVTATHVGLGNVTNESKATMFTDPTFTGDIGLANNNSVQWASGAAIQGTAESISFFAPGATSGGISASNNGWVSLNGAAIIENGEIIRTNYDSSASGVVSHSLFNNSSTYMRTPSADWTINFSADLGFPGYTYNFEIFVEQGATAYLPTAVQVNGVARTILWDGGVLPVGTPNGTDHLQFKILHEFPGGTYIVKASASSSGITTLQQTTEVLNTKSSATGTVVHDFLEGAIWYHSSISANFTANFTNVPTTDNRTIICTLILNQGSTAYVPNAVQINGVTQTINWTGSAGVPAGDANDVNIATFVLIRQSSTWQVLGSIVNNPAAGGGAASTLQDVTTAGASTSNAVSITNATASTSTTTGALVVSGGVGISENLTVGGNIKLKSNGSTSLSVDAASFANAISLSHNTVDAYIDIGQGNLNIRTIQSSKSVNITGTTATTSSTTGALTVAGGVGIAGDLFVGGTIDGYAPLNSPSFTGTTLTAGSVLFTNQDPGNTGTDTVTAPYIEASLGIYASFFTNIFGDIAIGPSGDNTGVINFQRQAVFQQTSEVLNTKTSATGPVEHDFETGAIWYHSSISANFTANFTRVPTTENRTINVVLVLTQGATAYIPNAVQIGGAAQTILWLGGTAPTGNANKTDIVSFTLLRTGSNWTVLGSLSSYG